MVAVSALLGFILTRIQNFQTHVREEDAVINGALDRVEAVLELLNDGALLVLCNAELLLDVLHLLRQEVPLLLLRELLLHLQPYSQPVNYVLRMLAV